MAFTNPTPFLSSPPRFLTSQSRLTQLHFLRSENHGNHFAVSDARQGCRHVIPISAAGILGAVLTPLLCKVASGGNLKFAVVTALTDIVAPIAGGLSPAGVTAGVALVAIVSPLVVVGPLLIHKVLSTGNVNIAVVTLASGCPSDPMQRATTTATDNDNNRAKESSAAPKDTKLMDFDFDNLGCGADSSDDSSTRSCLTALLPLATPAAAVIVAALLPLAAPAAAVVVAAIVPLATPASVVVATIVPLAAPTVAVVVATIVPLATPTVAVVVAAILPLTLPLPWIVDKITNPLAFRADMDESSQRKQSTQRGIDSHALWMKGQENTSGNSNIVDWNKTQQGLVLCHMVTEAHRYSMRPAAAPPCSFVAAALPLSARKADRRRKNGSSHSDIDICSSQTASTLLCDIRLLVKEDDDLGVGRYESLRRQLMSMSLWSL